MKRYRVWTHFNRNNMQKGSPNVWTVHYRGACYQVPNVKFLIPMQTAPYRKEGPQPRGRFIGWAEDVWIGADGEAIIE